MRHATMPCSSSAPAEQAGEIAWTADGNRVGFMVNGYQLRVFYDAATRKLAGRVA